MTQLKLAFVLRIWEEGDPAAANNAELRGSLHWVDTGDIRYFADLKQVEVILQKWIRDEREKRDG